ncbi:hypothetical protein A8C56_02170 [Niabella ginsenosidivorans]|uniref:Uncharacterized protein n=1 Tax=Niabella ginsenosidivorans TaxID=1176587 RepID=A0A1A9HZP2_9BACT|nr:hypothetical protein A8C56_02170 [Niabella ginsenosidivorans]
MVWAGLFGAVALWYQFKKAVLYRAPIELTNLICLSRFVCRQAILADDENFIKIKTKGDVK